MANYKKIKDIINMNLIKKSGYFDANYYKNEYSISKSPLKHYYYEGYKKGYNPSTLFDNDYYLNHNMDVKKVGINPLLHYIVSGKQEGRKIKECIGLSVSNLYYQLNHEKDSISVFLKENIDRKRISILIGKNIQYSLIGKIIKRCLDLNDICRIIYQNIDFDKFKLECKKNKIELDNIEFYKYNDKCLLDVYLNEKFVCFEYMKLFQLLNTPFISKPVYFYYDVDLIDDKDFKWLSYFCYDNDVILIGDEDSKVKGYNLVVDNNNLLVHDDMKLGFKFRNFSIEMLFCFQKYFLRSFFDKKLHLYYWNDVYTKDITFDDEVKISYLSLDQDVDVMIYFSYNKIDNLDDKVIQIYFKECNKDIVVNSLNRVDFDDRDEMKEIYKLHKLLCLDKEGDINVSD